MIENTLPCPIQEKGNCPIILLLAISTKITLSILFDCCVTITDLNVLWSVVQQEDNIASAVCKGSSFGTYQFGSSTVL